MPVLRKARTTTSEQTPVSCGTSPFGYAIFTHDGSYPVVTLLCATAGSSNCVSCGEVFTGKGATVTAGDGAGAAVFVNLRAGVVRLQPAARTITSDSAAISDVRLRCMLS